MPLLIYGTTSLLLSDPTFHAIPPPHCSFLSTTYTPLSLVPFPSQVLSFHSVLPTLASKHIYLHPFQPVSAITCSMIELWELTCFQVLLPLYKFVYWYLLTQPHWMSMQVPLMLYALLIYDAFILCLALCNIICKFIFCLGLQFETEKYDADWDSACWFRLDRRSSRTDLESPMCTSPTPVGTMGSVSSNHSFTRSASPHRRTDDPYLFPDDDTDADNMGGGGGGFMMRQMRMSRDDGFSKPSPFPTSRQVMSALLLSHYNFLVVTISCNICCQFLNANFW